MATEVVTDTDVVVVTVAGLLVLMLEAEDAELILGMRGRLDNPLSLGFRKDRTFRGLLEFFPKGAEDNDCPLLEEFNDLEEFRPLLLPDTEGELLLEYFPFEPLDIPEDKRPLWDNFLSAAAVFCEVDDDEPMFLLLGNVLEEPPKDGGVFADVGVDAFPGGGVVPPALEFPEVRMDTAPIRPIVVDVGVEDPGEDVGVGVLELDTAELGGIAIGFNLILGVLVMSLESSLLTLTLDMDKDL